MTNLNNGTFALDANYDWSLDSGGNLPVIYGNDTAIQNVTCALRLWRGEYEYNTTIGVNYKKYLGDFVPRLNPIIQDDLTNAILSITGVASVSSLTFNYDKETNALQGTALIILTDGMVAPPIEF